MPAAPRNAAPLVTALCWVVVVFDGYDLIVYGTALPRLLTEPGWNLTSSTAGLLGSLAFAGMLLGALLAGRLADTLGRRRTILACTAWFSVFTALCAIAPDPVTFGAFRLLAGLGLGGLVPSANALGSEFVPARSRSVVSTLMMSGVPIGGSLAALIGIAVLPRYGWEAMFLIALLALVLVLPLCAWLLPESPAWLRTRGRTSEAEALEQRFGLVPETRTVPQRGFRALLKPPYTGATVAFALATLATLFAWYGLGTWLPQLMRQSGFDLGSSLTFLLALNLGAVAGSLVTAWAGARMGPRRAAVLAAAVAAVGLLVLVLHPAQLVVYLALVLAGVGTHGTQCLIIAAVADHYPAPLRGSALGSALGVGRIGAVLAPQAGGWLLAAGLGVTSNFLVFAIGAAVASGFVSACPRPVVTQEGAVTR
ncbi:MFS transporter [Amycolatopsis thermophila]|uniref:AAHS family benzoate transporter-like MFS transporter n=1 Tax=Amycolatopsis thermophila TaxID=206084 RepID=A0ABU0EZI2_9PSEU|nr:aromatic acid/H+ symport family MFS transporter [Amycolatopsis thermophila]MDQ0380681.1 AAHS family benzoate transporter-like MFS transporter [Amycolatopsis thermophila]